MPNSFGPGSAPLSKCSMAKELNYYILFETYEQGMALHDLLTRHHIDNRIAPTPRAIQGRLSCGMSLLIRPELIDGARSVIQAGNAVYYDIVPVENAFRSRRDRYC